MKPTLFIVCGLPFSGKTHLSKLMSQRLGCANLSYDELWQELKSQTGQSYGWEDLSHIARQRISIFLDQGQSVIYDTLNDTVGNREALRQLADQHSAQFQVIFVDTPINLIHQRQHHNQRTNQRHSVPDQKLQDAITRFEPPTAPENPILFTPTTDFDNWISQLLRP